ncbi:MULTISPECIES: DUF2523 family protein [Klebsiella]|uniref:DUF2523 domain-containing protein n=1 Tax=Klebsiella quasipneumoniae TaxID=1463165 RepID=A0A8H9ZT24_9ENTR|nr:MULTISPECIES: DUF2523 family protein [Klebsiella]MBC5049076.1 DUF2523 domain-containing protein [Klebsiella quasipneumoniae]UNX76632.1 DUF2523 domain-containing protein [Klebsiella aerogenes]
MYAVLLSALTLIAKFLIKGTVVKFIFFSAIAYFIIDMVPYIITFFIGGNVLYGIFDSIPSGILFFLNIVDFKTCFQIVLSAYTARFVVRRLPVVG